MHTARAVPTSPATRTYSSAQTSGYAVIDLETTGFSHRKGDRIVEIGVVKLDPEGNIVGEWETLVNPRRDVGASHIHGITASDVVGAPVFDEVADALASELAGSVFVAHNAGFDAQFVVGELGSAGRLNTNSIPYLDTMMLAKSFLRMPRVKLDLVCAELGIVNEHAHCALADARATAEVLQFFLRHTSAQGTTTWADVVAESRSFSGYQILDAQGAQPRLWSRADAQATRRALHDGSWVSRAVGDRENLDDADIAEYFELLDRVLLDRKLTVLEQRELLAFSERHGLSAEGLARLHQQYLAILVAAANADGVITADEEAIIRAASSYLGVAPDRVGVVPDGVGVTPGRVGVTPGRHAGTAPVAPTTPAEPTTPSSSAPQFSSALFGSQIVLQPGDRVTVTGPKKYSHDYWNGYFGGHGVNVAGIAKATKVLIAGNPDSMSGKAKKAREYGIPVIGEDAVAHVISFAD